VGILTLARIAEKVLFEALGSLLLATDWHDHASRDRVDSRDLIEAKKNSACKRSFGLR
jgi:hypothetical protein